MPDETEKPELLEQRVAALEKTEKATAESVRYGVGLVQWGFAIFSTVAALFIGGNAWLAKSNYDRDEKALTDRLTFLNQQLTNDSGRQFAEFRRETESSVGALSNNLQSQVINFQTSTLRYFSNAWVFISTNILETNITVMRTIATNNDYRYSALVTNLNIAFSNSETHLRSDVADVLNRVQTNVDEKLSVAVGEHMMLQASVLRKKPYRPKGVALADATDSIIQACGLLYHGHNEVNLRRCLSGLCEDYLPDLINDNSKATLPLVVSRYQLADKLKVLIADLTAGNVNERYTDSIDKLQYFLNILEGKVPVK